MSEYPLYIAGEKRGKLRVYKDGLMTVFDAQCDKAEGLIKLYAFGNGGKAYLGTMQPKGDGLRLVRRLSRSAMNGFPKKLEYAADCEIKAQAQVQDGNAGDILWRIGAKGCLIGRDGNKNLLAIPVDGARLKTHPELIRVIEGREYVVFPGKRNKK